MKRYRSARDVYADIERALAKGKARVGARDVLQRAVELLCAGRHYSFAAVSFRAGDRLLEQALAGERGAGAAEFDVPLKLVQRELGVLCARNERGFAPPERVLLKKVARALALYATGKGKAVMRQARQEAIAAGESPRGYQPSSERPTPMRRVAAGEKS